MEKEKLETFLEQIINQGIDTLDIDEILNSITEYQANIITYNPLWVANNIMPVKSIIDVDLLYIDQTFKRKFETNNLTHADEEKIFEYIL